MIKSRNPLSVTHPELAVQWHKEKNKYTPNEITYGCHNKVWWKCFLGHDWEARISERSRKDGPSGCPYCCNRKINEFNCLATTHPEIAKQWHPTKNDKLTPYDVTYGSYRKIWWKCSIVDDHEWEAVLYSRPKHGCPCCEGLKIVNSNCLVTTHPEIAKLWHPTKNGTLTPYDVGCGSHKKVWWLCQIEKDHEWETTIKCIIKNTSSYNGSGCPCCHGLKTVNSNCLLTIYPEIAKQWHPTKNGTLSPSDVTIKSNKKVWWFCQFNKTHEWISSVNNRVAGNNCPICNLSRGEEKIKLFLTNNNFIFQNQYRIQSCKNKNPLPFDFAIFTNGQTKLIEYQGEQHYYPIANREIQFKQTITNDEIKKEWCEKNNIELLIIPYFKFDSIENILYDFLKEINES